MWARAWRHGAPVLTGRHGLVVEGPHGGSVQLASVWCHDRRERYRRSSGRERAVRRLGERSLPMTASRAITYTGQMVRPSLKATLIILAAVALAGSSGFCITIAEQEKLTATDSGPKVFAHYFPPYPISLDNAPPNRDYYASEYLRIDGEGGNYASVGGLLRDRPLGRAPLADPDFRLADMRTEVRQAKAAGIDGFTLNIMSLYGSNWRACVNLMKAADDIGGFEIVPNLDVSAEMADKAPDAIATRLAQLYAHPSAAQVDGGYMLSSFAAEARSPEWWTQLETALARHGYPTKLIAVFLNPSDANFSAFAPIVYGYGYWGARTPISVGHQRNLAQKAHEMGRKWMEPVAFQDARPRARLYAEAGNSELLRRSWSRAISQHADYVQMVTWNDYSESTSFAPSMAHGRTLLDANRLYLEWFKSGAKPAITTDHLFLTHRRHPYAARTTSGIMVMKPTLDGSAMAARDTVEALVYLTAPAQVSITVGGVTREYSRPAGISAVTVPLRAGSVSAKVIRGSRTVDNAISRKRVTVTPYVQDMQYWAAGN